MIKEHLVKRGTSRRAIAWIFCPTTICFGLLVSPSGISKPLGSGGQSSKMLLHMNSTHMTIGQPEDTPALSQGQVDRIFQYFNCSVAMYILKLA